MQAELNIALVQTSLFWENREMNIEELTTTLTQINTNPDIIVLPETFTTGFSMKKEFAETGNGTLEWMKKMAIITQAAIAGSFFVNHDGDSYNALHFVTPNGKVNVYNKKHLFRLTNEHEVFKAGEKQEIVDYKGWKISLMVCYDLRFPVWMRRSKKHDYDIMLIVANWPEKRSFAWNQLLIARAIENQAYIVAVNRVGKDGNYILYSGDSAVINPMGTYLTKGAPFKNTVIDAKMEYSTLQEVRKTLPFYNDADYFEII